MRQRRKELEIKGRVDGTFSAEQEKRIRKVAIQAVVEYLDRWFRQIPNDDEMFYKVFQKSYEAIFQDASLSPTETPHEPSPPQEFRAASQ